MVTSNPPVSSPTNSPASNPPASNPTSGINGPAELQWNNLATKLKIPAKPVGLWTRVHDVIVGPGLLKFEATGTWKYSVRFGNACTADGDTLAPLSPSKSLCPKCPVGALIAKIGGSSADCDTTASNIYPVGTFCVLSLKAKPDPNALEPGPLFLTINDAWNGMQDNDGELLVDIFWAPAVNNL